MFLSHRWLESHILIPESSREADASPLDCVHSDKFEFILPYDHSTHIFFFLVCVHDIKVDIVFFEFWKNNNNN